MGKIQKNQIGFTVVEGLLIILVVAVIGFGGYYVWHTQHNKTKPVSVVSTSSSKTTTNAKTSTTPPNPYAGWKTYTLTDERLTFQYPSDWTLSGNQITPSEEGDSQYSDYVGLSAPGVSSNSPSLSIQDGTNTGGDYNLIYSNPVSVTYTGTKDYLVFAGAEHPGQAADSIGCAVLITSLAQSATATPTFPLDKNVTDSQGDSYMHIDACNSPGETYTTSTIDQAMSTPVFKDDELIIQSMHY